MLAYHALLEELIDKSKQLLPYGDNKSLANIYYCIANTAITIGNYNTARLYHQKCFELTELCHTRGVYADDQYYELSAALYHQKALTTTGRQAIQASLLSISAIEKMQNQNKKGYYYGTLCSLYMRSDYQLAQKYGYLAIEYGNKLNNLQILAHVYAYLAVADAKNNNYNQAIEKFKHSYKLHQEIHEGLDYLYSVLEECHIKSSEIR